MMKTTTIIISQSPLKSLRAAEALRMGVGLTLCNDAVQVLFEGDGVYAFLQTEPGRIGMPEYSRHLETLRQLGHRIFTERESLGERGVSQLAFEADIIPRSEVARLLLASDFVIRY
jgi:sulfur relay (sulfurtransferase) DsrF/TusC family protein